MTTIITRINNIVPIYPGQVPEDARLPYAFYSSTERPIVTKSGIAGSEGTLTISVVTDRKRTSQKLADSIVDAINAKSFGGITPYLEEITDEEDFDGGLYATTLTFNTLS